MNKRNSNSSVDNSSDQEYIVIGEKAENDSINLPLSCNSNVKFGFTENKENKNEAYSFQKNKNNLFDEIFKFGFVEKENNKGESEEENEKEEEESEDNSKNYEEIDKKKCSIKEHENFEVKIYCLECQIYMCQKCENHHSELFKNHHSYDFDKNLSDIFTGFCKEKKHKKIPLEYYCKDHNQLCCASCIAKIKGNGNGKHKDCEVCLIKKIKNKKKKVFKKIKNAINKREEEILIEVDKIFNNIFFNEEFIIFMYIFSF